MTLEDLQVDAWACADVKGWHRVLLLAQMTPGAYIWQMLADIQVDLLTAIRHCHDRARLLETLAMMVIRMADLAETVDGDLQGAVIKQLTAQWDMPRVSREEISPPLLSSPCDEVDLQSERTS